MFDSKQEKFTGIFGLAAAFTVMIYYMINGQIAFSFIYILLAGLTILLNVYTINCILNGSCNFYSWFLTIMAVFSSIVIMVMYTRLMAHNKGIVNLADK